MSRTERAPWLIERTGIDPLKPWTVNHPQVHQLRLPQTSHFATHGQALTFVLAQPEVRRRTSKPVDPMLRSADA